MRIGPIVESNRRFAQGHTGDGAGAEITDVGQAGGRAGGRKGRERKGAGSVGGKGRNRIFYGLLPCIQVYLHI